METARKWEPANDCPGYQVCADGLLMGRRGTLMKGGRDKDGYVIFVIQDRGKPNVTRKLHRVIAETFIGPIDSEMVVNHINGVKHDNRLCNLEIVTRSYNTAHSYRVLGRKGSSACHIGENNPNATFTANDVRTIRARVASGEVGARIAREYGVSAPCINRMVSGKSWAHVK